MTLESTSALQKVISATNTITGRLSILINETLPALAARMALAAIFLLSGRTKVDGILTVNDSAYTLFRED
jgi:putative oxidoreductase